MNRRKRCNQIIEQYYDEIVRYCIYLLKDDFRGAEDCAHDTFLLLLSSRFDKAAGVSDDAYRRLFLQESRFIRCFFVKSDASERYLPGLARSGGIVYNIHRKNFSKKL